MSKNKRPLGRRDGLVVQELSSEILVYDLKSDKALCLNETAALIWNSCDGTRDLEQLREHVSTKTKAAVNDDLIWLAIEELRRADLLTDAPSGRGRFDGIPRREIIKRAGIGAAIALPLVASIVAPRAANAASVHCSCPNGQAGGATSCINSPQCAVGHVCQGVTCNGGGNNCGNLNGHCV